jgi:predicted membrane-bound spermidine synthase
MGKKILKFEYLLLFCCFTIATCGLVYELVAEPGQLFIRRSGKTVFVYHRGLSFLHGSGFLFF